LNLLSYNVFYSIYNFYADDYYGKWATVTKKIHFIMETFGILQPSKLLESTPVVNSASNEPLFVMITRGVLALSEAEKNRRMSYMKLKSSGTAVIRVCEKNFAGSWSKEFVLEIPKYPDFLIRTSTRMWVEIN